MEKRMRRMQIEMAAMEMIRRRIVNREGLWLEV
jgi:hypothetical protein